MTRIKLMTLSLLLSSFSLIVSTQDNPCGVEGAVIEASSYQYSPSAVNIEAGQTVVWVLNKLKSALSIQGREGYAFYCLKNTEE